jgi:hypothetical protein
VLKRIGCASKASPGLSGRDCVGGRSDVRRVALSILLGRPKYVAIKDRHYTLGKGDKLAQSGDERMTVQHFRLSKSHLKLKAEVGRGFVAVRQGSKAN